MTRYITYNGKRLGKVLSTATNMMLNPIRDGFQLEKSLSSLPIEEGLTIQSIAQKSELYRKRLEEGLMATSLNQKRYKLKDDGSTEQCSVEEWNKWVTTHPDLTVLRSQVLDCSIITSFVITEFFPYASNYNDQMIVYETNIYGGPMDGKWSRSNSLINAKNRHNKAIQNVVKSMKESPLYSTPDVKRSLYGFAREDRDEFFGLDVRYIYKDEKTWVVDVGSYDDWMKSNPDLVLFEAKVGPTVVQTVFVADDFNEFGDQRILFCTKVGDEGAEPELHYTFSATDAEEKHKEMIVQILEKRGKKNE